MSRELAFLPRLSVNRPVSVMMCLMALLVVGLVSYVRVPVQLFPSGFTPAFLYVGINYTHRNSTPQESEQQVARPLEEALRTVKGIKRIRTFSDTYGVSAPIEFQPETDMNLAYNQVMDRLERLKLQLPEDARDQVRVWKFNSDNWEVMWMGISLDPGIQDPFTYLDAHVRRRLERVDGVARVDFWGVDEKEVMIELDPMRMEALGVNLADMVQGLQEDNFALSAGHVRESGKHFYVRSLARYQSLNEIQNLRVRTRSGDVRQGDVWAIF